MVPRSGTKPPCPRPWNATWATGGCSIICILMHKMVHRAESFRWGNTINNAERFYHNDSPPSLMFPNGFPYLLCFLLGQYISHRLFSSFRENTSFFTGSQYRTPAATEIPVLCVPPTPGCCLSLGNSYFPLQLWSHIYADLMHENTTRSSFSSIYKIQIKGHGCAENPYLGSKVCIHMWTAMLTYSILL